MNKALLGVILAFGFVLLESTQFVFFGGLLQRMSTFEFGFLVFGLTCAGFIGWTLLRSPEQVWGAFANPKPLIAVNVCAVLTFGCSLMSVQLLEPAITYTISAGTMPITTYVLHKCGVGEGEDMRNRTEAMGNILLFIGVVYLGVITVSGWSGFVRGDWYVALAGVLLAVADGVFFTWILILSQRMGNTGMGPGAVLGMRLPLFVLVAGGFAAIGVDKKEVLELSEITFVVVVGLLLTIPPLYLVQKAVSLISTLTLSAITALGPFIIFVLQIFEARVDYATATLVGLAFYCLGSLLSAIGAIKATRGG